MSTTHGPVTITVPRDRNGEFEPQIVPKHSRRVGQTDELVLSCYARGMSTRDIEAHLLEVYGVRASRELVSTITDVVTDKTRTWRSRPVEEVYPIVYVDGIRIKARDKDAVTTKVAYLVLGVDVEDRKHALGCRGRRGQGREALAPGAHAATQPRAAGHPDRLLRRADRAARRYHRGVP